MPSLLQSMHSVFVLTLLGLHYLNSTVLAQQTNNPVNGSAPIAPWSLILEDVVQLPNSARPEYLIGNPTTGLNYVIDQRGPIYSFDPNVVNPTLTLFLDLGSVLGSLHTGNESGVRGLAFHPDFSQQGTLGYGKMYTSLSRNRLAPAVGNPVVFDSPGSTDHWTIVGEWDVNANGTVDANSYRELMRIEQPFSNHNAGHIGFNPAADVSDIDYGNLYIAIGDGGSGGGPFDLSLDIDMTPAPYPHGKILRINPLTAGGDPYSVPSDNPFVGQADRVEEVWAYGLRNPHKFAWDSVTGEMYISDIGQGTVEEVSVGQTGANYGWNEREGAFVYVNGGAVSNLPADHPSDSFTYPVAQYDHKHTNGITGHGAAIVGGPVYRGSAIPELDGVYLFADFSNNPGPIFAVGVDDLVERVAHRQLRRDARDGEAGGLGGKRRRARDARVHLDHDQPAVLRDYAKDKGANEQHWRFLTGERDNIWQLSKDGFKLPVGDNPGNDNMPLFHASHIVVVDGQRRVRGYFDGLTDEGLEQTVQGVGKVLEELTPR